MTIILRAAAGLLCVTLAAQPALAVEIEPGMWQDNETGDVNAKVQPPKVSTDCISPQDAKDPVKTAQASMKDMDTKQCGKFDIKQSGNQILLALKCSDPKQGAMEISVVWTFLDAQHTTSVAKSVMSFGGQAITSNLKTESKWIAAACKK